MAVAEALAERELGHPEVARKTLGTVAKAAEETGEYVVERAELGDTAFAEHFLDEHRNDKQQATDLMYVNLPLIRAALAESRHKPLEAIAALDGTSPYGMVGCYINTELGRAYLETGQYQKASEQYKVIVANPGLAFSVQMPLAHLGLARAYAGMGNVAASRAEYQTFLTLWNDADPKLSPLVAARTELAKLH